MLLWLAAAVAELHLVEAVALVVIWPQQLRSLLAQLTQLQLVGAVVLGMLVRVQMELTPR
jgi:hypothetical protein